jgi:hypothetical protein
LILRAMTEHTSPDAIAGGAAVSSGGELRRRIDPHRFVVAARRCTSRPASAPWSWPPVALSGGRSRRREQRLSSGSLVYPNHYKIAHPESRRHARR